MSADLHARARALVDRDCTSEISQAEQSWLAEHLRNCDECNGYAELTARSIQALGSFSFSVDPGLMARTQEALSRRAEELEAERAKRNLYLRGFALASLLTVVGSLAAWPGWMWAADKMRIAPWQSQIGFGLFWVLPSATIAMLLLVGIGLSGRSRERGLI